MLSGRAHHELTRLFPGSPPTVWCTVDGRIPRPPRETHRAAGGGRLRPGRPRLLELLVISLALLVLPVMLLQKLARRLMETPDDRRRRRRAQAARADRGARATRLRTTWGAVGDEQIFDGDWAGAAGQLLLSWFDRCPNPRRLLVVAPQRIALVGPRQRAAYPARARNFVLIAEFPRGEVELESPDIDSEPCYLRLRFADGSWLILTMPDRAAVAPFLTAVRAGRETCSVG
ncbi:hypothetical protein [Micromonospora sp. NPDC049679]|uniref:hypothetical protein n=1 Tax=Micromonospora sp. NPDC049679 TaxID=3155920 RepID=UPI0034014793